MELEQVIEILKYVLIVVCGGLSLYFKYSTKAQTKAKQIQKTIADITAKAVIFIKEAEEKYKDVTNAGGQKFEEVVTKLYDLVPSALRNIITRDMIAQIVQSTFDEIEAYAKTQLDKAVDKIEIKEE